MKRLHTLAREADWKVWSIDRIIRLNGFHGRFVWWYLITTETGQWAVVCGFGQRLMLPIEWSDDDGGGLPLPLTA